MKPTARTVATAALLAGAASATAVLGLAAPAAAHIVVTPENAAAGGYARLALRVPTESDTLSTTRVQVYLDTAHPVASVLTEPVPGWTARTTTTRLATPIKTDDGDTVTATVGQITWTADSAASAIKPGQFLEFPLSLGPLPSDAPSLVLKALQTYSDGSVVRWIDTPAPGDPEPEHPAPVLRIQPPASAGASAGVVTRAAAGGSDRGALALGAAGAALGLAGLVLGGLALARTRAAHPVEAGSPPADSPRPVGSPDVSG